MSTYLRPLTFKDMRDIPPNVTARVFSFHLFAAGMDVPYESIMDRESHALRAHEWELADQVAEFHDAEVTEYGWSVPLAHPVDGVATAEVRRPRASDEAVLAPGYAGSLAFLSRVVRNMSRRQISELRIGDLINVIRTVAGGRLPFGGAFL